ncbi:uncharacterized protein lectin-46Ca [Drosophila takahashii]|uniref:uncharacterized protein lectin-46Ca n=1 Tax=Drosophila takahashii TaxID=29030 RepID=UPI001CF8D9E5|nr:uncharacterized protein LOC108067836 [Drosophila takahashii]
MRILPIVLLTLMAVHSGCGRKQSKKAKDKGPCGGKSFLKELNGKCYYVAIKKLNWFGAQNNCLRKGLNLADVSTAEEFKALTHHMAVQVGMDDYWFGGNDLQTEGRFQYISSGKLVRYMGDYGMVEATHRSNMDDCLEIRIRPNRTVVLDVNCQEKKYFVCEQSQQKCAIPTADSDAAGQHHSHEHLHHFHHDAGKKDKHEGAGKKEQSVESDSRPADNSNSTEIGVSKEAEAEGTTAGGEGETTTAAGGTTKVAEKDGATTAAGGQTTPADATAEPVAATEAPAATPAEGATTAAEEATPAAETPATEAAAAAETPAPPAT